MSKLLIFSVSKPGISIPRSNKTPKFIPHSPKQVAGKISDQETKINGNLYKKFSFFAYLNI